MILEKPEWVGQTTIIFHTTSIWEATDGGEGG
jgi:hypothetical protein